jgi:hypothetical protein
LEGTESLAGVEGTEPEVGMERCDPELVKAAVGDVDLEHDFIETEVSEAQA